MYTEEEKVNLQLDSAIGREKEIADYQVNIDNFVDMLAALPDGEWPGELLQYRTMRTEQLPLDLPAETVQLVADYQYRDMLLVRVRSERIEQSKVTRLRDVLKARIGETYEADLAARRQALQQPAA